MCNKDGTNLDFQVLLHESLLGTSEGGGSSLVLGPVRRLMALLPEPMLEPWAKELDPR